MSKKKPSQYPRRERVKTAHFPIHNGISISLHGKNRDMWTSKTHPAGMTITIDFIDILMPKVKKEASKQDIGAMMLPIEKKTAIAMAKKILKFMEGK
jgi:hypothetical protein